MLAPALTTILSFGVLASAQAPDRIPGHDAAKLQVLLVTGYNSTPRHDWRKNSAHLRTILEESGRFEVRINEEPRGLMLEVLRGYHVLLLDYSNYTTSLAPRWPRQAQEAYLAFLESGRGVVAYHAACGSFREWPLYRQTLGIEGYTNIGHGPYHTFTVEVADREHPITKGLAPKFSQWGEIYNGLRLRPESNVVARAYDDPANCTANGSACGSGRREPVLWTTSYHGGRVFVTVLGHDEKSISTREFQDILVRGVQWAATGAAPALRTEER